MLEYVEPIDQEFVCSICHHPWTDPKVTACDHIFCDRCIGDVLLKNSSKCPHCGAAVDEDTLRPPLPQLTKLADKLLVYCPNRHNVPPCTATVKRSDLPAHLEKCKVEFSYVDEASISEDLKCGICHLPWENPQEIPNKTKDGKALCGHIFCNTCLRQWNHSRGDASVTKCPVCSQEYTEENLQPPSRPLLNMLGDLKVTCPLNKGTGCAWVGKRGDAARHIKPTHDVVVAPAPGKPVSPRPAEPTVVSPIRMPPPSPPPAPAAPLQLITVNSLNDFDVVKTALTEHKVVTMAHIEAPPMVEGLARKPISISAAIDVSGSMQGEKLDLVKTALRFMVSELQASDELGIIAFDDKISEPLMLCKMDQHGKQVATRAIASLESDGYTNLSGGLFASIDQVRGETFTASASAKHRNPKVLPTPSRSPPKKSLFNSITSIFSSPTEKPPRGEGTPCSFQMTVLHEYTALKRDSKWLHIYRIKFQVDSYSGPLPFASYIKSITIKSSHGSQTLGVSGVDLAKLPVVVASTTHECNEPQFELSIKLEWAPDMNHPAIRATHELGKAEDGSSVINVVATKAAVQGSQSSAQTMRYVWVFTDGLANEGIQDPPTLLAKTKERLASHPTEISGIFSFGFGTDHNADLLRNIAESCQGSYFFIKSTEHIKGVFGECLGGLLSIVAQNITLELRPCGGAKIAKLMTSLPTGPDNKITMKDLYSEESRDVLVELMINTPATAAKCLPLLTWVLTYTDTNGAKQTLQRQAEVEVVEVLPPGLTPNTTVDEQRNRIKVTEVLEEAKKHAEKGEIKQAQTLLQAATTAVQASASSSTITTSKLCEDMQVAFTATEDWNVGGKVVSQMANMHRMQRSNAMDGQEAYVTSTKSAKKKSAMSFF